MSIHLSTPISKLTRVGKITAKRLINLGILTVKDLLEHYPARFEDYSKILDLKTVQIGDVGSLKCQISSIENKKTSRRKMQITECFATSGDNEIKAIWFNQPFITQTLKEGDKIILAGKIERDFSGLVIKSPQFEKYTNETTHTARLVPIYPTTANITQKQLRFLVSQSLEATSEFYDILPDSILQESKLVKKNQAIKGIHLPGAIMDYEKALRRLKFEELFLVQLLTEKSKNELAKAKAPTIKFHKDKTKQLVESLPFKLTNDQRKATWQILQDMEKSSPMNRLLQGDVGSGKTVVAAIAALNASANGFQTALMAPTEILALQHFETISKIFPDKAIALLTGKHAKTNISVGTRHSALLRDKKNIKQIISDGEINIIIGTHSIIQNDVEFKKLGLIIIDEQHRFGVKQRKTLKNKSNSTVSHLLSMTATPIPRSLALTVYGDLDISTIREMPRGRKTIITKLVEENKRKQAYKFISDKIKTGEQVFVVCPLISESDKLGVKSATQEYEKLSKIIFPSAPISLLHGRMKPAEKEEIMANFKNKKTSILVSTSVIEVGIDIPNATVMMIEGADRFGLSQLHQFRGRVGRGNEQAYCFLFTDSSSAQTKQRLTSFIGAKDGFDIADLDLSLRGPGQVYGTEQAGYLEDLRVAKLTDFDLISETKNYASQIIKSDPELKNFPDLKSELKNRDQELHFE